MLTEERLWKAVLLQAFIDIALCPETSAERQRAQKFVGTPSHDLSLVCLWAGESMDKVLNASSKILDKKWLKTKRQTVKNIKRN